MPHHLSYLLPAILTALEASGFVGIWAWNATEGQVVLDAGAARGVAGNPALAGRVIDLDTALACLHPEDRGWVMARIRAMGEAGGSMSAEYRVQMPSGETRWLLDRGRVSRQPDGTLRGCGIWLDITESRAASAEVKPEQALHPLEIAADHCMIARDAIHQGGSSTQRLMMDMLLLDLGRALASGLSVNDNAR